ncbi:CLUMA_CG004992, isoform A [Clunio marinus]|uniref:CLUMA_CG004989, isoform A n=1 Tax=Clunio marinus TaxID=568069 RepID=A0A1J1HTJ6_9DIPT|nr:CLUMA_CG004989, isoform A [Clunio marinus]CRK91318.1 CLUMA_CG004992, isoform A [Clunio marinus]
MVLVSSSPVLKHVERLRLELLPNIGLKINQLMIMRQTKANSKTFRVGENHVSDKPKRNQQHMWKVLHKRIFN